MWVLDVIPGRDRILLKILREEEKRARGFICECEI